MAIDKNIYYNNLMNDVLVLRSAMDLMDSETRICWSNKHKLPPGYAWNEDGYVITAIPYPYIRACVGLRFGFLIKKLGFSEFIRQNLIVLRVLNGDVHRVIVSAILYSALRRAGLTMDKTVYDRIALEVYVLEQMPPLDGSFITWRTTWFSDECAYNTVSKVLRVENSSKIDADRDLMKVDTKYITAEVAEFTGFSRRRIDTYWSEKQWDKKLRTLYTLEEAVTELSRQGIDAPTRGQIAKVAGMSEKTIRTAIRDMEKLTNALQESNSDTK
jgi:hypothetical protein